MAKLKKNQCYWTNQTCISRLIITATIGSIIVITILYLKYPKLSNSRPSLIEITDDSNQANINQLDSDSKVIRTNDGGSSNTIPSIHSCGDLRGPGQNVVAYCLYGDFSDSTIYSRYIDPMKLAIDHIQRFHPGWIIRIYYYSSLDDSINNQRLLQELFGFYNHVDLCDAAKALKMINMDIERIAPQVWRFLPLLDDYVDRFMSRDTDSVMLEREVHAVNEWLQSPVTFHLMRDHPWHCVPILAGLWGAKIFQDRKKIKTAAEEMLNYFKYKQPGTEFDKELDQTLLRNFIWPLMTQDNTMAHDSYCCGINFSHSTRPFPSRRKSTEYVGNILISSTLERDDPLIRECPEDCRPPTHLDWIYC